MKWWAVCNDVEGSWKKESEKLETGRSSPTEVDEPGHLRNFKNFFFLVGIWGDRFDFEESRTFVGFADLTSRLSVLFPLFLSISLELFYFSPVLPFNSCLWFACK